MNNPNSHPTLQVALIGYGSAAKVFHAPLISGIGGMVLACVCSSRPDDVHQDWPMPDCCLSSMSPPAAGCVKTLKKIFGQKIDRIGRPTNDDRHFGNGFGTPEFSANSLNLEFSHTLAALATTSR